MPTPNKHSRPRIVPDVFPLLANWRYVEYSLLRIIAGWGRCAGDWEDKLAVAYHTWLQADIVDRLRKRMDMYPGGKPDAPVDVAFETLCNTVLLAPTFRDAMAAVHEIINPALETAYLAYCAASHPVHDRPTFEMLHGLLNSKAQQASWYEGFRRRYPHQINSEYESRLRGLLAMVGQLQRGIEPGEKIARVCGVGTSFAMPITPGRVKDWDKAPNIMPLLEVDWATSIEARRLYFMIGYCWEMGVSEQQLRWIYHADFMPFDFIHAEARHLWDESRHGDSGYHRLRDFGLDFEHFGYSSYGVSGEGNLPAMTPRDVYEAFYGVTQIAETGYFETKRYCFDEFDKAGDDRSAEMVQFDIIDETSHVEYGRLWLSEMAKRAGIDEDYRRRGAADRAEAQHKSDVRVENYHRFLRGDALLSTGQAHGGDCVNPTAVPQFHVLHDERAKNHYQWLLSELRGQCPIPNPDIMRPNLPM